MASTTRRFGKPYIWVTWLTGWLADDKRCAWQPWFRAHFKAEKRPDPTFDLDAWKADHKALRTAEAARLRAAGYIVAEELPVKVEGASAILAGNVDILGIKYEEVFGPVVDAVIVECKTGQERASDLWQAITYSWAVPLTMPNLAGRLRAEVVYKSGARRALTKEEVAPKVKDLLDAIRLVAANEAPTHAPSFGECSRCDVTDADCALRVTEGEAAVTTEEF